MKASNILVTADGAVYVSDFGTIISKLNNLIRTCFLGTLNKGKEIPMSRVG